MAIGVFIFRERLTRASDRWEGRTRTDAEVRAHSRLAVVGFVAAAVVTVMGLFVIK